MTINFNNAAIINDVIGTHTAKNCKQVIDLDNGNVYASASDAAEAIGATVSDVSACCTGRTRTVKGRHLVYASHTSENIDALTSRIRTMTANQSELERKAALWDAHDDQNGVISQMKKKIHATIAYLQTLEMELNELEGGKANA